MSSPSLFLVIVPVLQEFVAWASGPGLAATVACGLLFILALVPLVRILMRQGRAAGFDEADDIFLASFRNSAHVLAIFQECVEFRGSPRWQVYLAGCRELSFHLIGSDQVEKNFATRLRAAGRISVSQMNTVRRAMKRAAGEIGLDYESVTAPAATPGSSIRLIGLLFSMAVFAEAVLNPSSRAGDLPHQLLPAFIPLALALVLSQMIAASAAALRRRTTSAVARLKLFPAELSILIERAFVDHEPHSADLPSVAELGAPVFPGFDLPPSDSRVRVSS